MPRRPNVTMNELETITDAASLAASDMHEMAQRILQGYCDRTDRLTEKVSALNTAIGGAVALQSALLQKLYVEAVRAETAKLMKERAE